ncbi:MAG: cytochrome c [Chitinophagaceae bacterium]|nr:cytochrome c [Chitinophagaceae bacterium]
MKRLLIMLGAVAFSALALSFFLQQDDPWIVPERYQKLKNPVVADEASINSGKEIYISYCRSCHGMDGKGSGKRAEKLNTTPSDFTSAAFQKQSDGALLYKIYVGHKDMPGFKNKMPGHEDAYEGTFDKSRVPGDLINFLRTFTGEE